MRISVVSSTAPALVMSGSSESTSSSSRRACEAKASSGTPQPSKDRVVARQVQVVGNSDMFRALVGFRERILSPC